MSIRKTLMAGAMATAISLGACSTTQVTDFLGQVQAAAASACAFVPTIDTVLAVAASLGFSPASVAAGAVNAVAAVICKAVPPPASARYRALYPKGVGPASSVGIVGGVQINGWRTH